MVHSQSLIFSERPEQIAHGRSFLVGALSNLFTSLIFGIGIYSYTGHYIQQWLEDATELDSLHTQLTDSAGKIAESGSR